MSQYSAGMARLTAVTALIGALIVIVSQLVAAYSLNDPLGEVITNITLLDKHGIVAILIGIAAVVAIVWAIATGSRTAAIIVIGLGAAVILTFFVVDLPDIGDTGLYDTPGQGNLDATSVAAAGLWLELTGGLILVLAGLAMATLNEEQLRAIGPERKGDRAGSGSKAS